MIEYKKCKGQNKAFGFESCSKEVKSVTRKYGLCQSCYAKWLYSTDVGKNILSSAISNVQKPRIELEKAKFEHKNNKSLSYLITNTVNKCHEFIRLRDKGKNCISCNEVWHSDFQAGHFYKAELYTSLKLDEKNINGQCQGCNLFKEGNEGGYRVGLIKRYSKGYVDLLDSKALLEKKKGFKWDRIELEKIRKYFINKIKQLKN